MNSQTEKSGSVFDELAAQWDSNPVRVELAQAVGNAIRRHVELYPGMDVLDFGAGTGLLTLALRAHVGTITALDTSKRMLAVLEEKLSASDIDNVRLLCTDIVGTALPQMAFDLIVSSMALHHVEDVPSAITRLRSWLPSGGQIALADLDTEDGSFHGEMAGVYHHGFSRTEISDRLADNGFVDVAAHEAYQIEKNDRKYGVFLVTGRVA